MDPTIQTYEDPSSPEQIPHEGRRKDGDGRLLCVCLQLRRFLITTSDRGTNSEESK